MSDWADAATGRNKGIALSRLRSGEAWLAYALQFVRQHCRTHSELFVDDLWRAGLKRPPSPRALGAVIQQAHREGWIAPQMFGNCTLAKPSVNSNLQLKPVWRSCLYSRASDE